MDDLSNWLKGTIAGLLILGIAAGQLNNLIGSRILPSARRFVTRVFHSQIDKIEQAAREVVTSPDSKLLVAYVAWRIALLIIYSWSVLFLMLCTGSIIAVPPGGIVVNVWVIIMTCAIPFNIILVWIELMRIYVPFHLLRK